MHVSDWSRKNRYFKCNLNIFEYQYIVPMRYLLITFTLCFSLPVFSQGSGNVLSYDGINQYINLGSQVSDNCRTLEFWFKPNTTITTTVPDATALVIRDYLNGDNLNTNEFGFYFTPASWNSTQAGKLTWYRRVGTTLHVTYSNSNTWQANVWYHVAGVIDPVSGMKMYINGVLQTSTDPSTQPIQIQTGAPTDMIAISTWGYAGPYYGVRFFNGEIDEMRFWTTARTQTEIRDNMCHIINPVQPGLQGYYRFDSNSTTTLTDLTGNNYNGTLVNIPGNSWHYSSAPIGDTSSYIYPSSWTSQTLSLQYAPGDQFGISNVTSSPAGAHIYRVNSLPNVITGLSSPLASYYGVFLTGTSGNYDVDYDFSSFTNLCSAGCIGFFTRNDNAVLSWNSISPLYTNCTLSKTNESTNGASYREEYILGTNAVPLNVLGNDTTLCASSSYLLNVNVPGSTLVWNDNSTSTSFTVNTSGIYWVDVTVNGCTRRDSVTVNFSTPVTSSVSSQTNVSCAGGTDGTATISPAGGSGIYIYSWSPAGGTSATSNGIPAGNYTCTITDSNGCSTSQAITITQPAPISIPVSSTGTTCFGGNNGTATAAPTGGTGSYTFSWSPTGDTNSTASNLSAGTYSIQVTDANGCISTQTIAVTQPSAVTASVSTTPANCSNDGSATATPSGGTGPYTYNWSSGGNAQTESNLFSGNYTVTITDALGCTGSQTCTVTQAGALSSTLSATNITCFGNANGSATVVPSGGVPPYTYSWAPSGGTNATANGLSAGTYTCTIADQNGCIMQQMTTITEPPQLVILSTSINILCNGLQTGSASAIVSGGTSPYAYSWSPSGGNGSSASSLAAGTYTVTVTDNSGCISTQTTVITQPPALTVITAGDSVCEGTGALISTIAGGGIGPYTYSWSNTATGNSVFVNPNQTTSYSVVVTDANGCTSTGTTTLVIFPSPVAAYSSNATNGFLDLNGSNVQLCFTDASSSSVSAWAWDMNGNFSIVQSPCITVSVADIGLFCTTLYVTDNHNCSDTTVNCITIGESDFSIPNVFTPNGDGTNDFFLISAVGMTSVSCKIYDRWGMLITEWNDPQGYWNGKNKEGKMCSDGTYYFIAELTDFTGETVSRSGFVQLLSGK